MFTSSKLSNLVMERHIHQSIAGTIYQTNYIKSHLKFYLPIYQVQSSQVIIKYTFT